MLQSVLVYSLLLIVMLSCGYLAAMNERHYLISGTARQKRPSFLRFEIFFPLIFFAVICGLRYDVGVDYLSYLDMYKYKDIPPKIEPLFKYLTIFCKEQRLHFSVYFGILAFIDVFFFFYAFKDERFLFPFLVFALFTNGDWMLWMNIIRQGLAICIWVYSIKYITEKKLIKYVLWGIVAFSFHRSAIILFIFYPILRNGKDYFKSIPLQLTIIAGAFGIRAIFNSISASLAAAVNFYMSLLGKNIYQSGYNLDQLTNTFFVKQDGTGIAFIFRIVVNVIIILYSTKLKRFYNSRRFNIIYFFYFIGLIVTYLFPAGFIAFTRPFRYFTFFDCIMLAYFLYYLYRNKREGLNKLMYRSIIILFVLVFYLSLFVADKNSHLWYQFYFQIK